MRSSISNSDLTFIDTPHSDMNVPEKPRAPANPPAVHFERPVPNLPWPKILVAVASITLVLMVAWEVEMRHLGLRAGDLDDGRSEWAAERRRVDAGPRDMT